MRRQVVGRGGWLLVVVVVVVVVVVAAVAAVVVVVAAAAALAAAGFSLGRWLLSSLSWPSLLLQILLLAWLRLLAY